MILADTTIWVDHYRTANTTLQKHLLNLNIAMHPYIVTELALGSFRDRKSTLHALEALPQVSVASLPEVRTLIEAHTLYGRGIGFVDAHLLASVLITPSTRLWTLDKRLQAIAKHLGIEWIP